MFHGDLDIANGLAVWLFTKGENTDDDWQRYCDAMAAVSRELAKHASPFAVQVIDSQSSDPNAKWRREIARASTNVPKRSAIAIVSLSSIVRGVITAVSWLRPPTYKLHIVSSESEAFALADAEKRGRGVLASRMLKRLRSASNQA
jgi:hypothetical protein